MLTIASPPSRRAAALLATAATTLVLAACGSDSDDAASGAGASPAAGGGSAAAAAPSNEQDTARVRLAQCLRENGVDVPDDFTPGPNLDVDPDELQAALDGPCQELQAGAFGDHSPDDQEFQDAFTKFAQCMRRNGVDFPDPEPGGGFGDIHSAIDPSDPEVQAGMQKCQDNLPQGGAGAP